MTARLTVHCAGQVPLDWGDHRETLQGVVLVVALADGTLAPLDEAAPLLRDVLQHLGEPVRIVPADAVLLSEGTPDQLRGQLCREAGHLVLDGSGLTLDLLVEHLQAIVRNDETRHEHHQPRRWDGLTTREASDGDASAPTRWVEPREMARALLRALGAELPDPFEDARRRVRGGP